MEEKVVENRACKAHTDLEYIWTVMRRIRNKASKKAHWLVKSHAPHKFRGWFPFLIY